MWKSKKFLNRALNKLTRFSPEELFGWVTYQEVLVLRKHFNIPETTESWPPHSHCDECRERGKTCANSAYFVVTREVAETFPLNKYYS